MKLATGNFNEENRIGRGGFGEMYKVIVYNILFSFWTAKWFSLKKTTYIP